MPKIRDPRGPRQRQDAFCLPILFEMAAIGGVVHTQGPKAAPFSSTAHISARVLSYFEFTTAEKSAAYGTGKNELKQDVWYAIDALESDGHIVREPRRKYSATNAGLGKVQAFLAQMPEMKDPNTRKILKAIGYGRDELLIGVLKLVESHEKLNDCVASASDQISLYRAAMGYLQNRSLTKFCAYYQDAIRPLLARQTAKRYGFTARL